MAGVPANDKAARSEHTHVVIDISRRGEEAFAALTQKLGPGELPKTMRARRAKPRCDRVIYRLPPGTHISWRNLGRGVTVRGCDANSVLTRYTLANTRPQADGRQWLWDPSRFAELMGQSSALDSPAAVEIKPDVDQAPVTEATDTAAPLDAGADDAESDTNPANHETNLNKTEAIMANPRKIDTESRSDAPSNVMYLSKLEAAFDLARRGFPVFPLVPNAKVPAIKNWQELATTDPKSIRQYWSEDPKRNIGIPTDGYIVIDVDPRNGGGDTFSELMLVEEFPPTARSKTQGGGDHVIYALPKGTRVKGGTHLLGQGLI